MASGVVKKLTSRVAAPRLTVLTRDSTDVDGKDNGEMTLYIKGFLGQGETVDSFAHWFRSHQALVLAQTHRWGIQAAGHSWHSGVYMSTGMMPVPVATLAGGLLLAARMMPLRWTPLAIIGSATADVVQVVGRLAYQYWQATSMAHEQADHLAEHLAEVRKTHDKVRLVAHSLGCRHAIAAVASMTANERPDVLHLCAPAVREVDVAHQLDGLAKSHTFIYYTDRDAVLTVPFTVMAQGSALGAVGPSKAYERVTAIDVGQFFDTFVHMSYSQRFPYLAQPP